MNTPHDRPSKSPEVQHAQGSVRSTHTGRTPLRHPWHRLWRHWRSLRIEEASWFLLLGLALGVVNVSTTLELRPQAPAFPTLPAELLSPLTFSALLMALWLPLERGRLGGLARPARLGLVCVMGVPLAIAGGGILLNLLGWPALTDIVLHPARFPAAEHSRRWGHLLGDALAMLWGGTLTIAVLEFSRQRRRTEATLAGFLADQAGLRRQAVAARLAARQAQLEPQFLFDALSAIEQAYARHDPAAAERMDALIRHLRVALPRLHRDGVTLAMEAELLQTYLAAAAPAGMKAPHLTLVAEATLQARHLPPMLLLPLLQRALQRASAAAQAGRPSLSQGWLKAQPQGDGWRIILQLDAPGLADPELTHSLAERLQTLSGPQARLAALSRADTTTFTLDLPA